MAAQQSEGADDRLGAAFPDKFADFINDIKREAAEPIYGRCCSCRDETGLDEHCPAREDEIHCNHWWDIGEVDLDDRPVDPEIRKMQDSARKRLK